MTGYSFVTLISSLWMQIFLCHPIFSHGLTSSQREKYLSSSWIIDTTTPFFWKLPLVGILSMQKERGLPGWAWPLILLDKDSRPDNFARVSWPSRYQTWYFLDTAQVKRTLWWKYCGFVWIWNFCCCYSCFLSFQYAKIVSSSAPYCANNRFRWYTFVFLGGFLGVFLLLERIKNKKIQVRLMGFVEKKLRRSKL